MALACELGDRRRNKRLVQYAVCRAGGGAAGPAHREVVPTDNTLEEFTFKGTLLDSVEGLQWNLNRHFDPTEGSWLSEDPIGFAGDNENVRKYVGQ